MVGDFFEWWIGGLRQNLPLFLQRLFLVSHPRLLLQFDQHNLVEVHWQESGLSTHRGNFILNDPDKIQADLLPPKKNHAYYQVDIRLNIEQVLNLQKYFPEAVRENLSQTVQYQLDRLTPFAASDVYFDVLESPKNKRAGELLANIFVVPKHIIHHIRQALAHLGVNQIHCISVVGASDRLNLANSEILGKNTDKKSTTWPIYFFLITLLFSLTLPLAYKYTELSDLDESISNLQRNATEQLKIREQLQQAEEAVLFLKNKRANLPMALDIVEQISSLLPTDSWLDHLSLNQHQLQLKGLSANALALIDILESSPSFSRVKFISPITRDKKTQRDRFHLQTKVVISHGE